MNSVTSSFKGYRRPMWAVAASVLSVTALLLGLLPLLVDGHAMRDRFIRTLSAWSGGPVAVRGHLRIASFAALSIEAEDVNLPAPTSLGPAARVEAKSITAVARLSSLLRGKLAFKKVVVEEPRILLRSDAFSVRAPGWGDFAPVALALEICATNPLADLELVRPSLLFAVAPHRPYRKLIIENVRLEKSEPGNAGPARIRCQVVAEGLRASFRGEFDGAVRAASGSLHLAAETGGVDLRSLSGVALLPPTRTFLLSGDFAWSGDRMALDAASLVFDALSATGSLTLSRGGERPCLEGTLGFDTLALPLPADFALNVSELAHAALGLLDPVGRRLDLDLRLSAAKVQAGSAGAGPLALLLSARGPAVSADIVEFGLLGGTLTGRIDYQPGTLAMRLAGANMSSAALAKALHLPVEVTGLATLKANVLAPVASESEAAGGAPHATVAIEFPSGGTIEGEMARDLNAASERSAFWGFGQDTFAFSQAKVDARLDKGGVAIEVDGSSPPQHVSGTIRVTLPEDTVSGLLTLTAAPEAEGVPATAPPTAAAGAADGRDGDGKKIVLSGTLGELVLSASETPALPN